MENKLRTTVQQTPGSFAANHQLGEFYFHSGKAGQAIPPFQAAYQIDPKEVGLGDPIDLSKRLDGTDEIRGY